MTSNSISGVAGVIQARAISLSTLHNRTASAGEPPLVLACTPLTDKPSRVMTEGQISTDRIRELHANLRRWSTSLEALGATVLAASFHTGVDEPAPELYFFDQRDIAALHETLGAQLSAGGYDPAAIPCVLVWQRASVEAQLELVSVVLSIAVEANVEAAMLAAARRWYELRRDFFRGHFDVILELDPDGYWVRGATAQTPAGPRAAGPTIH